MTTSGSSASSGDSLLDFRTVWLCSIAKAWTSKHFRDELLESRRAEDLICRTFSFKWPWEGTLSLRVVLATGFRYEDRQQKWQYPRAPAQEGLTLFVPLEAPKGCERKDHAAILAEYYRSRPSLLMPGASALTGLSYRVAAKFREHVDFARPKFVSRFAAPVAENRSANPSGQGYPDDGFLPSSLEFANFEVALLHAIADAWEDPEARRRLEEDPTDALKGAREYEMPWILSLRVKNDSSAKWDRANMKWHNLSANELTLSLPETPAELAQSRALADYNCIGAAYPFTCCP